MVFHHPGDAGCDACGNDRKPEPFVKNVMNVARQNQNFRTELWTGCYLQLTVMQIPVCGDIGVEMHPDTDQAIRVEAGQGVVRIGSCREKLDEQCRLEVGDVVIVPAGTWHNVFNTGNCPLKLSSFYAPPQHPRGTVHRTKQDAEKAEC